MSLIKIFVTHISNREDEVIDNPLYINVIAGADYQKKEIPKFWMTDNTGDNISSKNKYYCELSTQYWVWKNIDSEYYGFCHYRRYLSMSDKEYKSNDPSGRGQVFVNNLNSATVKKYKLDDEMAMKNYIEKYDCILPKKQNLSKLPTPKGRQSSVYKHFEAHDRLFMNKDDLNTLLNVIEELYPNYLNDAKEFLNDSKFWGYSCFVLKKKYFNELCEFEFSVLEEMEKRIDISFYNQQQSRMTGFMGEILSGIYFYHLIKNNSSLKVAETQLIYFAKTEKINNIIPLNEHIIPYIFNLERVPDFLLLPTLQSFLKNTVKSKKYDLIILHWNMKKNIKKYFEDMIKMYENVRVSFIDNQDIFNTLNDLELETIDSRILLPWILVNYKKARVFNWNVFINGSLDYIENIDFEDNVLAGCKSVLRIGMANDVSDKYEIHLKDDLKLINKFELLDSNMLLMNLEKIRDMYSYKTVFDKINGIKNVTNFDELLNLLIQQNIKFLDHNWNYYYTEDIEENRIIKQIPQNMLEEYNENKNNAKIISYNPSFIWSLDASDYNLKYWNYIRTTNLYHLFFGHMAALFGGSVNPPVTSKTIGKKLIGGLKCVQDHGLLYTIKYTYKRFCSM